jgi:hypothetical protein
LPRSSSRKARLEAENAALRHQLIVLQRKVLANPTYLVEVEVIAVIPRL